MQFVYFVGCTFVLSFISLQDLKNGSIHWAGLLMLTVFNWVYLLYGPFPLINFISAIVVLVLLSILSVCSNQQFGMGDVWVIAALVMGMGIRPALGMLLYAACGVLFWAFIQSVRKRSKLRGNIIPFLPFITSSYAITMMMMIN